MYKSNFFSSRSPGLGMLTAVNIGGALEWYEIGLFISWPLIIQQSTDIFDQAIAESLNTAAVLLMVALALASGGARAIGGWFFGRKGDQEGRKVAFSLTVLLAALPSLALACLSMFLSYEVWNNYATVIFTIAKFLQGIPAGGEFPGAICYLAETEKVFQDKPSWISRRYMCSYAVLGPQIGLSLSTAVCLILKYFFPSDVLLEHGWKFVFLISGLFGIGGYIMRNKLHETAAFLNLKTHHKIALHPVKIIFSKYLSKVLFGFVLSIFETILFIVISLMPLFYAKEPFNFSYDQIFALSLWSTALRTIFLLLIGRLSSRYINFPWLKTSAFGTIVFSFLLYISLMNGNILSSLLINIVICFLYSIQSAILPSLLAELFPTRVRYTGIAFSFNICDGILLTVVTSFCFLFISNNNASFVLFLPVAALIYLINIWLNGGKKIFYR